MVGRSATVNLAAVDRDLSFGATRPFAGAWDPLSSAASSLEIRATAVVDFLFDAARRPSSLGSVIIVHPPPCSRDVCCRSAARTGRLAASGRSRILREMLYLAAAAVAASQAIVRRVGDGICGSA